jgi:hypothetical protein
MSKMAATVVLALLPLLHSAQAQGASPFNVQGINGAGGFLGGGNFQPNFNRFPTGDATPPVPVTSTVVTGDIPIVTITASTTTLTVASVM